MTVISDKLLIISSTTVSGDIELFPLSMNRTNGKPKSFYEATKHLLGKADGPPDLATNKSYLDGYGAEKKSS